MNRFVVDASISLAWCFPDETATLSDAVLKSSSESRLLVPSHWFMEVSNGLLMAEKRKRIQSADTSRALALLESLPIDVDGQTAQRATGETLNLARAYGLTVYDAAYMELAIREAVPLATLDRGLQTACELAGVARLQV